MAMFLLYLHAVAGCGWLLLTVMRWKMLPNWLHWVKFYHEPHHRRNNREGGGMIKTPFTTFPPRNPAHDTSEVNWSY